MDIAQSSFTGYRTWGLKEDGSLMHAYEDEQYKTMLKYWRDLFTQGVLDPEVMITSFTEATEKFCTGRVGALMMNVNATWFSTIKTNLAAYKEDAEVALLIPLPEGPAGSYLNSYFGFSADSSFSAKLTEEKAARILTIFDYLLSEEGRELTLYGFEGEHHDVLRAKKYNGKML